MEPYGEVFLSANEKFYIICTRCDREIIDYNEFQNHVLVIHLDPLCTEKNKNSNTSFVEESTDIGQYEIKTEEDATESNFEFVESSSYSIVNKVIKQTRIENESSDEFKHLEEEYGDFILSETKTNESNLNNYEYDQQSVKLKNNIETELDINNDHLSNQHKEYYKENVLVQASEMVIHPNSEIRSNCEDNVLKINKNEKKRCEYCGELFDEEYLAKHQSQRRCGKCPVCLIIGSDIHRHVRKFHKEYVEKKRELNEPVLKRAPLNEEEILTLLKSKEEKLKNLKLVNMKKLSPNEKVRCKYCGKFFYEKHILTHQSQRRCGKCPVCLKSRSDVYSHVRKFHKIYVKEKRQLKEKIVQRRPINEEELLLLKPKLNENIVKKVFFCKYCEQAFKDKHYYDDHIKKHEAKSDEFEHLKEENKNFSISEKELNESHLNNYEYDQQNVKLKNNSDTELDINNDHLRNQHKEYYKKKIMKLNNENEKKRCEYCGELFDEEYLAKHQSQRRCGKCPVCLKIGSDLHRHVRKFHKEYVEKKRLLNEPIVKRAPLNEEEFLLLKSKEESLNNLELVNMVKLNPNEKVRCKYCGKFFYGQHFLTHKSQRRCGKCPVCLTIVSDLFRHIPKFHKEYVEKKRLLKEPVVQRSPINEEELLLLQPKLNENIVKKVFFCKYCEQTFEDKHYYDDHIKKHEAKSDEFEHLKEENKNFSISEKELNESHLNNYEYDQQNVKLKNNSDTELDINNDHLRNQHKEYYKEKVMIQESKMVIHPNQPISEVRNNCEENVLKINENEKKKCQYCGELFDEEYFAKHQSQRRCGKCPVCLTICSDVHRHVRTFHKEYVEKKRLLKETVVKRAPLNEEEFLLIKSKEESLNNLVVVNLETLNPNEKVRCIYCGKFFYGQDFPTHHSQRRCGKCPVCLTIVTNLFRHIPKFHKEYVEKKRLLKEQMVTRVPLYKEELLLLKPKLSRNVLRKVLFCKYCERTFKYKHYYDYHIKKHETKSDTCKYCGKCFKNAYNLKQHLRVHTGERPYQCDICSVSFKDSVHLKRHFINRHTEGLHLKCTHKNCEKVFKTNIRRRYHEIYAHSNRYKNLCKECGLIFSSSSKLNTHYKRKHLKYEDREFSCSYCDKKFAFKFELVPHEMLHTGQKKYHCELCLKGFISRKSFKRHCRGLHGKEIEEISKNE